MNDTSIRDVKRQGAKNLLSEQGFFDKSPSIRSTVGLVFAVCLFLFLHVREAYIPLPKSNGLSDTFVIAQVDFEFPDEKATQLLKQEAGRDIGAIYRLDEKELQQCDADFQTYLTKDQSWRSKAPESTFDEIYNGIDLFEEALGKARYADQRTINKMQEIGHPSSNYETLTANVADESLPQILPDEFWQRAQQQAFAGKAIQPKAQQFIINYFKQKEWTLEEDSPSERILRDLAQEKVPEQYTKVIRGTRLIDRGEKVSERHVAMLQAMERTISEKRNLWHTLTLTGTLIFTVLFMLLPAAYLRVSHPDIFYSNKQLFLLVFIVILTMFLAKIAEYPLLHGSSSMHNWARYPLFVPFAAILLASLLNARVAIFVSGFLAIVMSLALAVDPMGFLVVNLFPSLIAILCMRAMRQRKEIFAVCGVAWIGSLTAVLAFNFYDNSWWGTSLFIDMISTFCFMAATALLVTGLLPPLESGFHLMTDMTLIEYMDPTNELLRRLSIEAPGTYQHSMVIGNLAEAGATAIGANGLFCRVATLYHDIGKLNSPYYFTENQQGGINIHQLFIPLESAQVIIGHVSEGVALARKKGLPEPFIDIIKEHHGTTLVYYFYHKQVELMGGDESLVNEKDFRYAGPKPHSKESAIIMIADTVEAASRSLDDASEQSITEMVDRLVEQRVRDGQFDECRLAFEELGKVKKTMVKSLVAASHSRIKYPQKKKD